MKTTLAVLLGMVACKSATAVSEEDQATMSTVNDFPPGWTPEMNIQGGQALHAGYNALQNILHPVPGSVETFQQEMIKNLVGPTLGIMGKDLWNGLKRLTSKAKWKVNYAADNAHFLHALDNNSTFTQPDCYELCAKGKYAGCAWVTPGCNHYKTHDGCWGSAAPPSPLGSLSTATRQMFKNCVVYASAVAPTKT